VTRTETIKARVTLDELARVDILAAERGIKNRSEYVRRAAQRRLPAASRPRRRRPHAAANARAAQPEVLYTGDL